MDELQSVLLNGSLPNTSGIPGTDILNPPGSPIDPNQGGALQTPTLPANLLQPSPLNEATMPLGKGAIAPTPAQRLSEPAGATPADSLTGNLPGAALVGNASRAATPASVVAGVAIPNFTIMTEQSLRVNGGGDFDGVPSDLTDDALIYAKTGFRFNGATTLPVQRDVNGNPILSNGKPLLVENAVSVSAGYTSSIASSNPYANLVPPSIIDPLTVVVPDYLDLKQQEYARRVPVGTSSITYNIQQNPISTAAQWAQKFPGGGTIAQPKVVVVQGGALTLPANLSLSNTVIILESGNLTLAPSGGQTLTNVMLVTNAGSINLNKVSATDVSVFSATSLTMGGAARFSGSTMLANASATSDITFSGATTNTTDMLKVIAQGNINYSGAADTRGQFLTAGAVTSNGSSTLYGSVKAKGDITFNGSSVVVAIPATIIDTTAPSLTAALVSDTALDGTTNSDRITSNPAIAGSVTDAGTVTEFKAGFGNTPVANYANVLVDRQANGSFSFTRARLEQINGGALADGTYTLNLQAKDQAGNLTTVALTFTLDTTTATPTVTLSSSSDTGSSNSDRITKIKTPTLSGKAEAGSVVKVSSGTQSLGTATTNATGDWQLTVTPLNDGTYNLTATSTDVAGNISTVTPPLAVTIDSLAPQVTLTTPVTGLTTGSKLTGNTNGNGSAIAALTYRFDNSSDIPVTLNASGAFDQAINLTGITQGSHTLTITATDSAGNITTTPYNVTVTFDTTPPVITAALATDTGTSNSDRITSNAAIVGTVTDQNSIASFRAGFGNTPVANYVDVSADRQANGSFNLSVARLSQIFGGSLPDGVHTLNLQAADQAGNLTTFALTFTLDTTTATPTVTLGSSSDTGISNSDRITKVKTPSLSGKAEAGSVVKVSSGTQILGTATANSAGDWQLTVSPLNDGTYSLSASSTDIAGNVSGNATPLQVTIDSVVPQLTLATATNAPIAPGTKLTGSTDGSGSPITALTYRFDGLSENAITLNGSGSFDQAIDLTGITPGSHVLTLTLTDAAGNTSLANYPVTVKLDITPPVVTVQLANDTAAGATNTDRLTSDPAIAGTVSDLGQISQLELSFGNTFLDITPDLKTNGTFSLDRARLESLKGSKLADGAYLLSLRATDASGNVSVPVPLSFTLDTTAPVFPSFQLAAAFDTSPVGDRRTTSAQVTLVGQAEANQTITLLGTGLTTQTDTSGQFQFTSIALALGTNILNAQAVDAAGNTRTFSTAITRMSKRDMVLDWNAITLQAIQTGSSNPPKSSRVLGMVQAAVYDAVNAIDGTHEVYYSAATAPAGASAEAAVAAAAHKVLVSLYPNQATGLNAEYVSALATIADGVGKTQGITLGEQVAQDILDWRSADGSDASVNYTPGTAPGQWQPTSAASALLPGWGNVTPFALTSGDQFRPSGAPALTSAQYATDFNQVKDLGRVDSATRTSEQTEIAKFWADGAGTETPAGHWNTIAANAAITQGLTLTQEARLFALLDIGLADAGIAAWDAKYTYNSWRPVTAIRGADSDGNAATVADATWTPLINTPPFPEYVSGHSTYSGAADAVLTNFFDSNVGFTAVSSGLSGVTRTFDSFSSAANEAGISRIYGGIHFNSANQDGLATGRAIGGYVASNFLGAVVPPPQLQAGLANDTAPGGVINSDGITSDATISGSIINAQAGMKLRAGFGNVASTSFVDVTSSIGTDGRFTLNRVKLEQVFGQPLVEGTQTIHLRLESTAGTLLGSKDVTLMLDTIAPTLKVDVPLLGGEHSSRVRLIGTAIDVNGVVATGTAAIDGQTGTSLTIDSDGNFDQALATTPLSLGSHQVQVALNDHAGNLAQSLVNFNVSNNFTVTDGLGWGAKGPDPIILEERNSFAVQTILPVQLGQAAGSRKLRFEVDAKFDKTDASGGIEDTLLVYLVDANNPAQTLLDGGEVGSAFFSLTGTKADFTPGLVTFDGSVVEVDLTELQSRTNGVLRFQLVNIDGDSGSRVTLKNFSNEVDLEGVKSPVFSREVNRAIAGGAMNLTSLSASSDLKLQLSDMSLDVATGTYKANVQVKNEGAAVGRQMALKFVGLPVGVQILNASGADASGNPYINLRNAIQPGGLDRGAVTDAMQIVINNPNNLQFDLQPTLLTGGANKAPVFNPVGNLTVMPGGQLNIPLVATDPDGDSVMFSYRADNGLPTGTLNGSGSLVFNPKPGEEGTYSFTLIATDGGLQTEQAVTLTVVPDPVTTTRISGVIQNTSKEALAGVVIDLGGTTATTAADGSFQLEFSGSVPSDTLKILIGNVGDVVYPSIAEKLPMLFGHELYNNVNNVIARPIYLPPIDMANARAIDPNSDITVTTTNIAGASVFVAAGSLNDRQGNPYTGQLSITEVPVEVTPAALPENLHPDLVVTIQPGEMVFTTPAPLSLPNRAGYAPGALMDLWSINPVTGLFDAVGKGQVSADGTVIETIEGGIRNSSWHFFTAQAPNFTDPRLDPRNHPPGGNSPDGCQSNCNFTSEVDLHSGAVLETHDLVTYQSLGQSRGLTLTYDSLRADTRPIIHFGFSGEALPAGLILTGRVEVQQGNFNYQVSPGGNLTENTDNLHYWRLSGDRGNPSTAIQMDLRGQSSGRYKYNLSAGFYWGNFVIRSNQQPEWVAGWVEKNAVGDFVNVNTIDSPFGSGWGLDGWQELIENSDGSVLLIDGNGGEQVFEKPRSAGAAYGSQSDDFSTFERLADGTFRRTMKDKTIYQFNNQNQLAVVRDRNGNETRYIYDANHRLIKMIDPVSLETTFSYTGNRISSITDPALRVTRLEYDSDGNLMRVIDPNTAARTWEYDSKHHMVAETDQRGYREEETYDFAGRAIQGTLKNGAVIDVNPLETQGLVRPDKVSSFQSPVVLRSLGDPIAQFTNANGQVTKRLLNQQGQVLSAADGGGTSGENERDSSTRLITTAQNGRGYETIYTYDSKGNVTSVTDEISKSTPPDPNGSLFTQGTSYDLLSGTSAFALGDVDGDQTIDLIVTNSGDRSVSVLLGKGNGTFDVSTQAEYGVIDRPSAVTIGDLNGDGKVDLVTTNTSNNSVSVLLGNGDGTFAAATRYGAGPRPKSLALGDLDKDGDLDIAIANQTSGTVSILNGNGNGTFAAPVAFNAGAGAAQVNIADLDQDGNLDLVTMNTTDSNIAVLLGLGNGSFDVPATIALADAPSAMAVADIDGDGKLDIVVATDADNVDNLFVLQGQGDGNFVSGAAYELGGVAISLALADVNQDKQLDIIIGSGYGVSGVVTLPGRGDGTFGTALLSDIGENPQFVAVADLDDDKDLDLVTVGTYTAYVGLNGTPRPVLPRRYTYDSVFNQVISETDELGRQTIYEIDPLTGNQLSRTQVVGEIGGSDDVTTRYTYTPNGLVDTITDPLGRVTDYDYNASGRLSKVTYAKGTADEAIKKFEYDAAGNQSAVTDENGNRSEYLYDLMNYLKQVTEADPDGVGALTSPVTSYTYDLSGNQKTVTDARSNTIINEYDAMNHLLKVTQPDPDGSGEQVAPTVTYQYDKAGNKIEMVDPLQRKTQYRYDSRDRLVEIVLPDGKTQKTRYDKGNNLVTTIDATGSRSSQIYDERGRLIRQTDADGGVSRYEYDAANQLIALVDANMHRQQYAYDELGRRVSVTDARGKLARTSYDKAGNVINSTDQMNHTTRYVYDNRNRQVQVIDPLNHANTTAYDAVGNQLSVTDALNHVISYGYDALNRQISMTDALNHTQTMSYDAEDNLVAVSDPLSRMTRYTYDGLNRKTSIIDPLDHTTKNSYDSANNLIGVTDALGHSTVYGYDRMNRQTSVTDALGQTTTTAYDFNGNVVSIIDANQNQTTYQYDKLNRRTQERNASDKTHVYRYDLAGNLISTTDKNGRQRTFSYDENNRIKAENWLNLQGSVIRSINYDYDDAGRLTFINDPDSSYAYTYDDADRLTSVDNAGTLGAPNVVQNYGYDAANRAVSTIDVVDGQQLGVERRVYDNADRLIQITQNGSGVADKRVDISYNNANQLDLITRYSDLAGTQLVAESDYDIDAAGRLSNLLHKRGSLILENYSLDYDAANRLTELSSSEGSRLYDYDDRNQLTELDYSSQIDESYSYDANGNRTNAGYQTRVNNQLSSDGVYNYFYDSEGNLTEREEISTGQTSEYAWDYHNRLTQVIDKTASGSIVKQSDYTYDALDRRITRTLDDDGVGASVATVEQMIYNGANITLTFDEVGNLTHRYLYGSVIDQVLADETSSGQILWALSDNQGSVQDVIDSAGSVLNHVSYDGFGKVISETSPTIEFRFGYTGRDRDEETGLDYYRSRYYNPAIGRFISEDPIEFAGGDGNLYRYVGNSPSTATDPSGLLLETLVRPVATAVGGAAQATGLGLLGTLAIGVIGVVGGVLLYQEPLGDTEAEMLRRARERATPPGTGTRSRNQNPPSPGSPTQTQTQPDPTPTQSPSASPEDPNRCRPCEGETQGGSYIQVRTSNRNGGAQVNHIPAWNSIQLSGIRLGQLDYQVPGGYGRNGPYTVPAGFAIAPTICMVAGEHQRTASNGNRSSAVAYRERQSELISVGRFEAAQNLDIADIHSQFGSRYDVGIIQMQNYTATLRASSPHLFYLTS
jgi:RHS repeat-associated protein